MSFVQKVVEPLFEQRGCSLPRAANPARLLLHRGEIRCFRQYIALKVQFAVDFPHPGGVHFAQAAVYTQLSDVEDEVNGLVTFDRRVCKMDPARMRKINEKLHF